MAIRFEYFGLPRARAGAAFDEVPAVEGTEMAMRSALRSVLERRPSLSPSCVEGDGELTPLCIANVNGQRFTRDGAFPLKAGDVILILSADAGG